MPKPARTHTLRHRASVARGPRLGFARRTSTSGSVTMSSVWEPPALSRVEVDEVWKAVGRYGRFQVVQIFILLVSGLSMAFPVLSGVFEGLGNPHTCRPPATFLEEYKLSDNDSVTSESCRVTGYRNDTEETVFETSSCDGYEYEFPYYVSFVSEWNLVCSRAALVQLSQTLVMAGMFVGASLLTNLADRYGRKWTHLGCHLALLAATMAMAFMPTYGSFIATKFFAGVFQQGYLIPMAIHLIELLPAEQRAVMGLMTWCMWSVSIMSLSPIAYVMKSYSWRSMQIVFASFHAVCFIEIFILDESLRWLVANHRFKDIRHAIRKAAKYNHHNPETVLSTALARSDALRLTRKEREPREKEILLSSIAEIPEEEAETAERQAEEGQGREEDKQQDGKGDHLGDGIGDKERLEDDCDEDEKGAVMTKVRKEGFLDLVKDPDMRFLTLTMLFIWMTNSLTYYGVTLLSSSLAGNLYVNFFLGGLLEIPSNAVMCLGLARIGRKKTNMAFIALAGVSLLGASAVAAFGGDSQGAAITQTVLSLTARFAINGSFNTIWIYTPELFPTNLRNLGVGISSSSARIGGMAAPFFNLLAAVAIWAPGVILSVLCLVVTFLLTLLPETKLRPLPQTIQDVKAWRREDKKGRK